MKGFKSIIQYIQAYGERLTENLAERAEYVAVSSYLGFHVLYLTFSVHIDLALIHGPPFEQN